MTSSTPTKSYLKGKKLNKIEQHKANKDGLSVGSQIETFSKIGWEAIDKTDLELRLKWYGMFWRPKTPGKFMLRLRIPNGVLNSEQLEIVASIVARYGEDGSCDITTRQNLQLRGILISDLPEILHRIEEAGLSTIQSGFDNPRNVTGNPLAGIDPEEIIDTRPYTYQLEKYLTNYGAGNPDFSNLPRKWNTAVAGAKDNFLLHNDIIFHPVELNGSIGFGVWVGGILSSQLNEYAVPLDVWVKPDQICKLTGCILSIWRDYGERDKRPKGRFRFFLDKLGINQFRQMLEQRFGSLTPDPGSIFNQSPRSIFGFHPQKQKNKYYAGIHVPVGRLKAEDLQDLALVSQKYGLGEIRLTEDQNIIIIGIDKNNIENCKADALFTRFSLDPNNIEAGTVSCTGNSFCSFALTNTKDQALKLSKELAKELYLDEEVKIHWTGCPNSCGQAYLGAIGLTGKKAKDADGNIGEAYDISIGGSQGKEQKIGKLIHKAIPKSGLKRVLKDILIKEFKAIPKTNNLLDEKNLRHRIINSLSEIKDNSNSS